MGHSRPSGADWFCLPGGGPHIGRPDRTIRPRYLRPLRFLLVALVASSASQAALVDGISVDALAEMSLEELGNIRITSVSRVEQPLAQAAAAVSVVTESDIRRAGATSVPEALRMVPGLHVAQQDARTWAVSSRGFSSANSEKLLVLSDTRSIYTPLVSGVAWEVQDHILEDIERIEVIRGPGASLWGSNAVNGIINITTKAASETQGLYAQTTVGTEEQLIATARYGGEIGEGIYYRVFGKHSRQDDSDAPAAFSEDDWEMTHVGFRADWQATRSDAVTLQGDLYDGRMGQLTPSIRVIGRPGPERGLEIDVTGGNLLGRWQHRIDRDSGFVLRAYYDRTYRDDPSYRDELDTYDIDFQHDLALGRRHALLWGLNYRITDNHNESKGIFALQPPSSRDKLVSLFVQDQITLLDSLHLTIGTKLEHNDFSGSEVQPSVRLAWTVAPAATVWAAVSRAARVPTRYERDIAVDASDPAADPVVRLLGNRDFGSEELTAYEIGFRWQATAALSFDLAAFRNRYEELASVEFGDPFLTASGQTVLPIYSENIGDGDSEGFEAFVSYTPLPNWRLSATYSYLHMDIESAGLDLNRGEFLEGSTPRHQLGLRSSLDWRGFQIDLLFRHHSEIESIPEIISGDGIGSYSELDLRIARRLSESVEIALVGQNLLHERHVEFGAPGARGEIERSVYGRVVWRFP